MPLPAGAAVSVSSESPRQGQTIEVCLVCEEPSAQEGEPDGRQFEFQGESYKAFAVAGQTPESGRQYCTLLPIPADLSPGNYLITCGEEKKEIKVLPANFPTQKMRLPKVKDNFQASPGELEAVDEAKATLSGHRLWHERFQPPASARISTVFGVKRIVNGKLLTDYFHSGLDYAAPLGAKVKACAPGQVVLSHGNWRLHGSTVAIDHGQGVVSFYIHLQKVLVRQGQLVKGGELIGRVGQSGRANGPHLHFSLYVNKVATNPTYWFKQVF